MGFLDAILGRSKPAKPNLDVLFAVPAATLTLEVELGLRASGVGAVCFATAEGRSASAAQAEAVALLEAGSATSRDPGPGGPASRVEVSRDDYGYTWVTVRRADADLSALVTDLHALNTTLADAGYGPGLLCTVIGFAGTVEGQPRRAGLVYLFKRGTFYPFAPTGDKTRDTSLELRIRAQLTGEVPVEADLSRWFPIWDSPGV